MVSLSNHERTALRQAQGERETYSSFQKCLSTSTMKSYFSSVQEHTPTYLADSIPCPTYPWHAAQYQVPRPRIRVTVISPLQFGHGVPASRGWLHVPMGSGGSGQRWSRTRS